MNKINLCICTILTLFNSSSFAAESLQFAYTFENQSIGQIVDSFSEQFSTPIERRFIQQSELKILLLETIETGTSPDVVLVPSDHTGLYRPMRFSIIPNNISENQVTSENWQTARVDGNLYGAPIIRGNHLMLFYNRSLVDSPASTWQELINQQSSFAQKQVETIAWNFNEMYFFIPFLGAFSGWPVENGQLTLNSIAMVDALKAYRSLSDGGLVDPECDYDCAMDAFQSGKLAYTINGDWALKDFQQSLGDNLGIAILPSWKTRPLVPMFSTHVLVFPDNSLEGDRNAELTDFVSYLQSYDVQKQLWNELRVFPVEEQAYQEAVKSIEPSQKGVLEQLNTARAMPSDRAMSYAWGAMAKAYTRYMNDVLTAEQAAELMQKLAERELSKD